MTQIRRHRGVTLIEALVVLGMFGLILTVIATLLYYTMRWRESVDGRQSALQDLSFFTHRLKRQLKESTFRGVSVTYPSGDPAVGDLLIGFPSARDANGDRQADPVTAEPIYQEHLIYFRDGEELKKSRVPIAPPLSLVVPLTPAELVASSSNLSETMVGRVKRFLLVDDSGNPKANASQLLRFRLEVESDGGKLTTTIPITEEVFFLY